MMAAKSMEADVCTVNVENLRKDYRMGDVQVPALRGVDIRIQPGEFTVLAGPSGSGKTTLLNMIGLLDVPTSGSVELDGRKTSGLSEAELDRIRADKIGFIFQSFNLVPVLDAFENVELALRLCGTPMSSDERSRRSLAALAEVGLGDFASRRSDQLSGGQQQRVAIARALVKRSALVIADEPTANLDSASAEAVLDVMEEMNRREAITFLFSSHDDRVIRRARRVIHLADGRIVSQ